MNGDLSPLLVLSCLAAGACGRCVRLVKLLLVRSPVRLNRGPDAAMPQTARSKIIAGMADLFAPPKGQTQERNWTPFIIGLVAVLVAVGIIVALTRNKSANRAQVDPYVSQLQISTPKLSAAENYVGGTVTYLDATITNTGAKSLSGADMKLVFRNTLNEVVQTETIPLHVLVENQMGGYPDLVDLGRLPIGPGQSRAVRMTLEHISADWNQSYPEMQLVDLKLKG